MTTKYSVLVVDGEKSGALKRGNKTEFTKITAEKYATELRAKGKQAEVFRAGGDVKKNPAPKKPTSKRAYVDRPSQATKKAPSARLKKRRTKNMSAPAGYFPNPAQPLLRFVIEGKGERAGEFHPVAYSVSSTYAKAIGQALADYTGLTFRVKEHAPA